MLAKKPMLYFNTVKLFDNLRQVVKATSKNPAKTRYIQATRVDLSDRNRKDINLYGLRKL